MQVCRICQSATLAQLIDLGQQPISTHYVQDPAASSTPGFHQTIGQCSTCGTIQLIDPVPVEALIPHYNWIRYNEPEAHLDHMVEVITGLEGIQPESVICGLTYKEDTTIARLNQLGYNNTWRMDLREDLQITWANAGMESVQQQITSALIQQIAQQHGQVDVVIVRHVFEHAHQPAVFLDALKHLVRPNGYIVIEVPDCERSLNLLDYTTFWEDHILYFTPRTFRHCFAFAGLEVVQVENYPYPFENSLVAFVRVHKPGISDYLDETALQEELQRGDHFAKQFELTRTRYQEFLSSYAQNQGKVALFGAGHLAGTFITLMGLKDVIAFVVDDDPNKRGLYMPGSHLPILESSKLLEENIKLCLLTLAPSSEAKVIQKNQAYLEQGGSFFSIFPASANALKV